MQNIEPNLSQYFKNDPPSFFDEITYEDNAINQNLIRNEHYEINDNDTTIQIDENIQNYWELPEITPGLPPSLTILRPFVKNELPDKIQETINIHLDESDRLKRKFLNVDDVTQDERGIRDLIQAGCFRSAITLTGRLLTIYEIGLDGITKHSPNSLQLWFTRLALLIKLGEYDLAKSESEPFGQLNRIDMYFEFYPDLYPGKKGSMASFSFRLLLAEIPMYTGAPLDAMNNLTNLLTICERIENHFKDENINASKFWRQRHIRIIYSLINCSLMLKNFSLVDDLMIKLFKSFELSKEKKRILLSTWGRIYLQIGDIFGAEQKFSEARQLRDVKEPNIRDYIDKGLIAIAQNDFQEGYMNFEKALQLNPNDPMILNNMSVCLLYLGQLKKAIENFEKAINLNPRKSLNENLLINLSTLYELESSNSDIKKTNLLRLTSRFKSDLSINPDFCLKLETTK